MLVRGFGVRVPGGAPKPLWQEGIRESRSRSDRCSPRNPTDTVLPPCGLSACGDLWGSSRHCDDTVMGVSAQWPRRTAAELPRYRAPGSCPTRCPTRHASHRRHNWPPSSTSPSWELPPLGVDLQTGAKRRRLIANAGQMSLAVVLTPVAPRQRDRASSGGLATKGQWISSWPAVRSVQICTQPPEGAGVPLSR
jgi:hypothetical protein